MILFENATLWDGAADHATPGMSVLVEGERIREVSAAPIASAAATRVDVGGRTLMPGLIDAHVHVIATDANLQRNAMLPDAVIAFRAARIMRDMLHRGFTTIRDLGGATFGLRLAWEEGHFEGPRMVICGKALGQTGGHSDTRGRFDSRDNSWFEGRLGALGRIVDGVDSLRRACREEIKAGADFIKVMANGGVASPVDPIAFLGFSEPELRAAVEEAAMAQTYVAAHLYTDEAIARAVRCGILSLEHCNLIAEATARAAAAAGCIACPTLVTYEALAEEGASFGLGPESIAKIETVRRGGLESLDIMRRAGLTMAFGTDLLGQMHRHQSREFEIRGRVLPGIEVLRSATIHAARLLRMEDRIGRVAPGMLADLIVVEGDPLAEVALLSRPDEAIAMILQGGRVVRSRL